MKKCCLLFWEPSLYNHPLPVRGPLRLSLEGKCSGSWVVAAFPSIVWLQGLTTPTGYSPTPKAWPWFLILKLIIYFSTPQDLSSSLIRGELFNFRWQGPSLLQVALEMIWKGSEGSPVPGCSLSGALWFWTALSLLTGFPTPGCTILSWRESYGAV